MKLQGNYDRQIVDKDTLENTSRIREYLKPLNVEGLSELQGPPDREGFGLVYVAIWSEAKLLPSYNHTIRIISNHRTPHATIDNTTIRVNSPCVRHSLQPLNIVTSQIVINIRPITRINQIVKREQIFNFNFS